MLAGPPGEGEAATASVTAFGGAPWAAGSLRALEAKVARAMTRDAVTAKRAAKDGIEGVFSSIRREE